MERLFRNTYGAGVQAGQQGRPAGTRKSHWELYPARTPQVHFEVGIGEPGTTRSPPDLCEAGAPGPREAGTDPNLAWPCFGPNHGTIPWRQAGPRRRPLRSSGNEIVLAIPSIKAGRMTTPRSTDIPVACNRYPLQGALHPSRRASRGRGNQNPSSFRSETAWRTRVCVRKFWGGGGLLPAIKKQRDQHLRAFSREGAKICSLRRGR